MFCVVPARQLFASLLFIFFCEGGTLYVRPMLLCCIIPSDIVEVELTESLFSSSDTQPPEDDL